MAKARDLLANPKFVAEFREMMKTPEFSALIDETRQKQAESGQDETRQGVEPLSMPTKLLQEKTEAAIAESSKTLEDLKEIVAEIRKDASSLEKKAEDAIAKGEEDLERLHQVADELKSSVDATEGIDP